MIYPFKAVTDKGEKSVKTMAQAMQFVCRGKMPEYFAFTETRKDSFPHTRFEKYFIYVILEKDGMRGEKQIGEIIQFKEVD